MTVGELISELEQFDSDLDICVQVGSRSYKQTDIYFESEKVWSSSGDSQYPVLMMRGEF